MNGLRVPTDSLVFGWQRETSIVLKTMKMDDHEWSPHANGLACLWMTRETSRLLKTMKQMTMIVFACQWTHLSLDGKGDFNSLEKNENR